MFARLEGQTTDLRTTGDGRSTFICYDPEAVKQRGRDYCRRPEVRRTRKKQQAEARATEEGRARRHAYQLKYRAKPETRAREQQQQSARRATPAVKAQRAAYAKAWAATPEGAAARQRARERYLAKKKA